MSEITDYLSPAYTQRLQRIWRRLRRDRDIWGRLKRHFAGKVHFNYIFHAFLQPKKKKKPKRKERMILTAQPTHQRTWATSPILNLKTPLLPSWTAVMMKKKRQLVSGTLRHTYQLPFFPTELCQAQSKRLSEVPPLPRTVFPLLLSQFQFQLRQLESSYTFAPEPSFQICRDGAVFVLSLINMSTPWHMRSSQRVGDWFRLFFLSSSEQNST